MANGLFETPQDILARRKAEVQSAVQGMQQRKASTREGQLVGGLGSIAQAYLGQRRADATQEKLNSVGAFMEDSRAQDAALAQQQGLSPEVIQQQTAANAKLREEEISNSGLSKEMQKSIHIQDALKHSKGSPEGLMKLGAKLVQEGSVESGIALMKQAKSLQGVAAKAPTTRTRTDKGQEIVEEWSNGKWNLVSTNKEEAEGSTTPSASKKKYDELIKQNVPHKVAQDVAYNVTSVVTDPTTGDLVVYDPRSNAVVDKAPEGTVATGKLPDGAKQLPALVAKGSKVEDKTNTQVTALSTALEKANILEMGGVFDLVDKQILQTEGDLAGFGQTSFLNPMLLSQEGLENRQLIAQIQNVVLKNRSGAAVTATEFERLKKELGTGKISGDREVRNALKRMKELFDDHKKSLRAGFSDEANSEYDRRLSRPVGTSDESFTQVGKYKVKRKVVK